MSHIQLIISWWWKSDFVYDLNTFMSRMLWMNNDSSRQTTNRCKIRNDMLKQLFSSSYIFLVYVIFKNNIHMIVYLLRDSSWQLESCSCNCNCIFRSLFWSGKLLIFVEQNAWQWQQDYLKIAFQRYKPLRFLQIDSIILNFEYKAFLIYIKQNISNILKMIDFYDSFISSWFYSLSNLL